MSIQKIYKYAGEQERKWASLQVCKWVSIIDVSFKRKESYVD